MIEALLEKVRKYFSSIRPLIFSWHTFNVTLSVIGIFVAVSLANQESLERFKQIEPARLEISNVVNVSDSNNQTLTVLIKNLAQFKNTGNISFYRLEINPYRPFFSLSSLAPGENTTVVLSINYTHSFFSLNSGQDRYTICSVIFPADKLLYIEDHTSISYRITCDNCNGEGIVKRIPTLYSIESGLVLNTTSRTCQGLLPVYRWTDYSLQDLNLTTSAT